MEGTAGFEPARLGVKVPCLAAWLCPCMDPAPKGRVFCYVKMVSMLSTRRLHEKIIGLDFTAGCWDGSGLDNHRHHHVPFCYHYLGGPVRSRTGVGRFMILLLHLLSPGPCAPGVPGACPSFRAAIRREILAAYCIAAGGRGGIRTRCLYLC